MPLPVDDDKLLGKYKIIWTKTEDLKILNWMRYQVVIIDIWKLKQESIVIKLILIFAV